MFKILLLLVACIHVCWGEFYSSLGHMEDLVHEELNLVSTLKEFISAEEAKLERIKKIANEIELQAEEAGSDVEKFLGNPVNQYLLLKRLKTEYDEMETLVMKNSSFLDHLGEMKSYIPGQEDVEGTAKAIMRLQDTYKLDTHELAQGKVKSSYAGRKLTADDCFQIGRTAYLDADYYHCVLWMKEADDKIQQGDTTHERFEVLDHLAFSLSQQSNWEEAYALTEEMLKIDPDHKRIQGNREFYRQTMQARKKGDEGSISENLFNKSKLKLKRKDDYLPERQLYEKLCREGGEITPPKIQKKLKCYYWDNNDPLLRIQPLKMEELYPSPHVVRFYNITSPSEIDEIIAMAKPRLNRATVQNPVTGILEHAHYRVSKSAWLDDHESDLVYKISKRISAITGLSMKSAEELQIANYGVGGQYEPHYDFARRREKGSFEEMVGNRIATMLFYFTNVEYGGATVFLNAKIAVQPIKGSAVFWYNLYPSGDGDMRTRHAACPVLTGVKWVSNKWIHEREQEFRRPCGLEPKSDNRIF
uniref:prolyl 4-hydroxylase subunit alpha-1-like n=1 Tax=Styela clava TaxID=7725 RepID=UPI00193A435C|nr:prolyl 4-hydroxylase subunit alpha-1-like [Styela clava]